MLKMLHECRSGPLYSRGCYARAYRAYWLIWPWMQLVVHKIVYRICDRDLNSQRREVKKNC